MIVSHSFDGPSKSRVQASMVMNWSRNTQSPSTPNLPTPPRTPPTTHYSPTVFSGTSNNTNAVKPKASNSSSHLLSQTQKEGPSTSVISSTPSWSQWLGSRGEGQILEFCLKYQHSKPSNKSTDVNQYLVTLVNIAKYSPMLLAILKTHLRERSPVTETSVSTGSSTSSLSNLGPGRVHSRSFGSLTQHNNAHLPLPTPTLPCQSISPGSSFSAPTYSHLNLSKTIGVTDWFLRTIEELNSVSSLLS